MPVLLEGGCRVSGLKEGEPLVQNGLRIWPHVDRGVGATAISLRVLEVRNGASLRNAACDEVLYVLGGEGAASLDGRSEDVAPDTGIYLRPGAELRLESRGASPLCLVSSRCPDPAPGEAVAAAPAPGRPLVWPFVRLWDRPAERTADRWYRVLVDEKVGCTQLTQFVGSIPPGRAPDHFHHYEEVLCILKGQGRMWAGKASAPIEAGSCVFLPRLAVHCVENTGSGELRLLGVFYPAGSPAVRYAPD